MVQCSEPRIVAQAQAGGAPTRRPLTVVCEFGCGVVGGGAWLVAEGLFVLEQAADVERVAVAAGGYRQPAFHRRCAFDQGLDFGELALGEVAYLLVGGTPLSAGGQQRPRVVEGEPGALGDVNHSEALDGLLGVAALAAAALGLGKDARALVIADRGGIDAGAGSDLADRERGFFDELSPLT